MKLGFAEGGPLVEDKLGFRISAWGRRDGGYIDRVDYQTLNPTDANANRVDTYALRAAFTWAPIPNLKITPAVDFQNRYQHNYDNYWVGDLQSRRAGMFLNGTPDRQPDRDHFLLPSLKIEWQGPGVSFISDTAYYARKERVGGYSGTLYDLSLLPAFPGRRHLRLSVRSQWQRVPGRCLRPALPAADAHGPQPAGHAELLSPTTRSPTASTTGPRSSACSRTTPQSRLQWVVGAFLAFNYQRSTEEINDPELPALTQLLWGEDMITAWGENLLPNGDDYIKDTQSTRPADRPVRRRHLQHHRPVEGRSRPALRLDPFRLRQPRRRAPGPARQRRHSQRATTGGKERKAADAQVQPQLPADAGRHGLRHRRQGLPHRRRVAAPAGGRLRRGVPDRSTIPTRCGATRPGPRTGSSTTRLQLAAAPITSSGSNIQQAHHRADLRHHVHHQRRRRGQQGLRSAGPMATSPTHFELELAVGYTDATFSKTALDPPSGRRPGRARGTPWTWPRGR